MDLKDMQYFCTIVEEGQISKAAYLNSQKCRTMENFR